MAAYTPPLRDMAFVLHEVLEGRGAGRSPATPSSTATSPPRSSRRPARSPATCWRRSTPSATARAAGWRTASVRTPTGFREAFDLLREGGWTGLDCDPAYGGQGMPYVLHAAVGEMHSAANMAFAHVLRA